MSETWCKKCAIWELIAKEYGKRGMCEECFHVLFVPIESNIDNLGLPWAREWVSKKELLDLYPE